MSSHYSLVVVTGANGYLGSHTFKAALDSSIADVVRAVVRSEQSATSLRELFAQELSSGKAEIVFVPDILVEGAYLNALKGADGVLHLASPLPPKELKNVEEQLLAPAKQGALNLLKAAAATPSVKKVVLTSSVVSALDAGAKKPIDNDTWNPVTEEQAKTLTDSFEAYMASKTLAEQGAWDFIKSAKPAFSLTALNPTFIIGPTLQAAPIDSTTNSFLWLATQGGPSPAQTVGYVDVRDVAKAHVLALTQPKTDGKRYLLLAGQPSNVEVAEFAAKEFPKGSWTVPSPGGPPKTPFTIDVTDLQGFSFRPVQESVRDVLHAELKRTAASL